MPEVQQPKPKKETGEKVQKPDIALPQDAIKKAKYGGGAAPLQQFTDTNKSKRDKRKGKPGQPTGPGGPNDISNLITELEQQQQQQGKKGKKQRGSGTEDRDVDSGMSNIRQNRARRSRNFSQRDDDSPRHHRQRFRRDRKNVVSTAAPRKDNIVLELPCTVRSFSEATGVSSGQILKTLMMDMQIGGVSINSPNCLSPNLISKSKSDIQSRLKNQ